MQLEIIKQERQRCKRIIVQGLGRYISLVLRSWNQKPKYSSGFSTTKLMLFFCFLLLPAAPSTSFFFFFLNLVSPFLSLSLYTQWTVADLHVHISDWCSPSSTPHPIQKKHSLNGDGESLEIFWQSASSLLGDTSRIKEMRFDSQCAAVIWNPLWADVTVGLTHFFSKWPVEDQCAFFQVHKKRFPFSWTLAVL